MDKQYHADLLQVDPHLTYLQREGKSPLPEMARARHLSRSFRRELMLAFQYVCLNRDTYRDPMGNTVMPNHFQANWDILHRKLYDYKMYVLDLYPSEIPYSNWEGDLKYIIRLLTGSEADDVVNLCDYFMRDWTTHQVGGKIAEVFQNNPSAYAIETTQNAEGRTLRYLYPAMDEMSAELLEGSIENINESGAIGVHTHIRQGATCLDARDYAGGVREGYLALESVARQLTGKSKQQLSEALREIRKNELIPAPALGEIIDAISGKLSRYANQQEGARHSLTTKDEPDIGSQEALFFYGMCIMAAGYLASKLTMQQNGEGE